MSFISRLEKSTRWIIVLGLNVLLLWTCLIIHQHTTSRVVDAMIERFDAQDRLDDKIIAAIKELRSATDYNFGFTKSNKYLILKVAESKIPDDVALLNDIPAEHKEDWEPLVRYLEEQANGRGQERVE